MTLKMRAVVYLGPEKIELREIPIPVPEEGELLVRIRAATTCGTDVKTYRRGHPKFPPPFVFGHEFAGDVVAVGKGVEAFHEGTKVTANVFAECGECFYCRRGQGNICENLVYNFGAFAEYMVIPASIVSSNTFEIPAHVPYAEAALLEPLVTVVHGWRKVGIQPGERVAIIGAGGPISLMFLQLALMSKASQIIAIGHSPMRLGVAKNLGATHVMNSKDTDPISSIHELTEGRGADVVIECAGSKQTWEMSVDAVRKGGKVLWFSGLPGGTKVEVDATRVHYGEITLFNVHGGTSADAREAFDLIVSGRLRVANILSTTMPLEKVETALKLMMAGEVVKVVIDPQLGIPRNPVDTGVLK